MFEIITYWLWITVFCGAFLLFPYIVLNEVFFVWLRNRLRKADMGSGYWEIPRNFMRRPYKWCMQEEYYSEESLSPIFILVLVLFLGTILVPLLIWKVTMGVEFPYDTFVRGLIALWGHAASTLAAGTSWLGFPVLILLSIHFGIGKIAKTITKWQDKVTKVLKVMEDK